MTARDKFTIHHTKDEVESTIKEFLSLDTEESRIKFTLGKRCSRLESQLCQSRYRKTITPIKIVLLDYHIVLLILDGLFSLVKQKGFHCMPRKKVMWHFLNGDNIGLTLCKQFKTGDQYVHAFIANKSIESSYVSNRTSEITSIFPLYLYTRINGQLKIEENAERTPNLRKEILKAIEESLGLTFTNEKETAKNTFAPINILDYIYAVLHSPTYRDQNKEFLKIDFPRVPYPKDKDTFWQLVKVGGELRQIHLLESLIVEQFITQYPISGNNIVNKPKYKDGRVYINEIQFFDNVPLVAWEFYIGGYQPAQKWLKDRKNRSLEYEDILHYQKIIVALLETDRLMNEVDTIDFL